MRNICLALAALLALSALNASAKDAAKRNDEQMALQLSREGQTIQQLQERLDKIQAQTQMAISGGRQLQLKASLAPRSLDQVPAEVTADGLHVQRSISDSGMTYKISAVNVPVLQVFEAIAKTSGLRLELHPDVGRSPLLGRIFLDMQQVEMNELLDVAAGTQSLGVLVSEESILVAPMTALSRMPVEQYLRARAVESDQNALLRFPGSADAPGAYLGIARYYAATGYQEAAIEAIQNILTRYPKSAAAAPAMLLMGNCYEETGHGENARAAYYRYVDNFPTATDLPDALMKIAATWTRQKKWDMAVPLFETVVREHPKSPAAPYARMHLAECLANQGQDELAVENLRALERDSAGFAERDELNMVLAECLTKLKQFGEARVCLRDIVLKSKNPAVAEKACYALGDTYLAETQPLPAVEAYNCARHLFPRGDLFVSAPVRLCRAYLQMGLYDEVEKELKLAQEKEPLPPAELRKLILVQCDYWTEIGQSKRILDCLAQLSAAAWPIDPEMDPEILLAKADALVAIGQVNPAKEVAARASVVTQDDALRARAFRIIGEIERQGNEPIRAALAFGGKTE